MFVEFGQYRSDRIVHQFDHARIDGAVLNLSHVEPAVEEEAFVGQTGLLGLVAVFFPELRSGLNRSVHRVKGKVGEEGLVLVGFDEVGGFLPEPKGQGFSGGSGFEVGVLPGERKSHRVGCLRPILRG